MLHGWETPCLGFLFTQGVSQAPRGEVSEVEKKSGGEGLPAFLSPAPPRSEGEALLQRIFMRGEPV